MLPPPRQVHIRLSPVPILGYHHSVPKFKDRLYIDFFEPKCSLYFGTKWGKPSLLKNSPKYLTVLLPQERPRLSWGGVIVSRPRVSRVCNPLVRVEKAVPARARKKCGRGGDRFVEEQRRSVVSTNCDEHGSQTSWNYAVWDFFSPVAYLALALLRENMQW